jgi:hypothetical protein
MKPITAQFCPQKQEKEREYAWIMSHIKMSMLGFVQKKKQEKERESFQHLDFHFTVRKNGDKSKKEWR